MKIGRWSLVVASMALLAPIVSAEEVNLKLACMVKYTEFVDNKFESEREKIIYLTFTNDMKTLEFGGSNTCKDVMKTNEAYSCHQETFRKDSGIVIRAKEDHHLDRRNLNYSSVRRSDWNDNGVNNVFKRVLKGQCELADKPKI
jgi:hypothetical protein